MKKQFIVSIVLLLGISVLPAQSKRTLNNDGVDLYKANKYADAEVKFKKSLEKDPSGFEGHFNLGDAYYKQGRYDEAIQAYKNSLSFTENKSNKARVYHNVGNSLLKQQKYQESLGAYKSALKANPEDIETKYNLSYALNMMKQNQDKQKQQNKNDKNKDKNKDQQQNKDQQKQDKKDQNKDQKQQQQQQQKNQISKEEAQRILEAMKNNEKDQQKKLRKVKGKPFSTDKDW
jgi:Ca-activated chloride channel homolog